MMTDGGFSFKWKIDPGEEGIGLVEAVSTAVKVSKEDAAELIDFGAVYVDGRVEQNPSTLLSGRGEITVNFPPGGVRRHYEIDPARIIFRDRHLLAYNKEPGIPSQQVPHDAYNNVYAALLRLLAAENSKDPYAAGHNRLDVGTSGILLFCLDKKINAALGRDFRERRVKKEYLAWVEGSPQENSWVCDSDIGKSGGRYTSVRKGEGKRAKTVFRVLRNEEGRSLVLAEPLTGRTHQIRIHLAEAKHPVLGDRSYGAGPANRLYLHAWRLTFKHPVSGGLLILEAPDPF